MMLESTIFEIISPMALMIGPSEGGSLLGAILLGLMILGWLGSLFSR